jgi:hypothetical protein
LRQYNARNPPKQTITLHIIPHQNRKRARENSKREKKPGKEVIVTSFRISEQDLYSVSRERGMARAHGIDHISGALPPSYMSGFFR